MLEYIEGLPHIITALFRENPWGQTVGLIAFIISIINFAIGKNKSFIFIMMIASGFWGVHFMLISALSASAVQFLDVIKNIFALKFQKNIWITLFFILSYIAIGFFTYADIYSLIPISTSIFGTILVFYVRGVWLNIGYLGIITLWFIYNMHNNSIGGVMSDVTLWVVGVLGIIRILITDKQEQGKI